MTTPDDVLAFWFEEPTEDAERFGAKMRRWFQGGAAMDLVIRERFTDPVERALEGSLDGWAQVPPGRLALILVLDQFARNLHRGSARAFAGASKAERLATDAIDGDLECAYRLEEQLFLTMPFVHAEDLALQEKGIAASERHLAAAPPALERFYAMGLEQARKYHAVIQRFGRFPHRNEALGRASTEEERAFLVDWAAKQAPRGADDLPR